MITAKCPSPLRALEQRRERARKGIDFHKAVDEEPISRVFLHNEGHRARLHPRSCVCFVPGSPMSGGYHARWLTDGVPVRSMKQLFELALQLEPPWRVVSSDFDFARRRVDLRLGFRAGSRFPCPQCGRACQAVEFAEGTWRQPDVIAFEAFVTAGLPSLRCPEHGDVALTPSWASDHVSLRALRDGNTDQLGDTPAHLSSSDARPPGSSGRARRRARR
jgi:hypothetical protein